MRYEFLNLDSKGLRAHKVSKLKREKKCVVCDMLTNYVEIKSRDAICSEECMMDWRTNSEVQVIKIK